MTKQKGEYKVTYKCAKCGETDSPEFYPNEQAPPAINCWNCHSGYGLDLPKMIQDGKGMFPVGARG